MKRVLTIVFIITMVFASTATAQVPLWHFHHHQQVAMNVLRTKQLCPSEIPTQRITVRNTSTATSLDLARVELAVHDQSLQLHDAWNTPCIEFGPGGNWTVDLRNSQLTLSPDGSSIVSLGAHHYWDGVNAHAEVEHPAGWTYNQWSRALSHEVMEMTVDPNLAHWERSLNGYSMQVEVCDPVVEHTYRLDNVVVNDFITPAFYHGGSGPYDQMSVLTEPFHI